MLIKHFILYLIINISLTFYGFHCVNILNPSNGLRILKKVVKLTDTFLEATPSINITITGLQPNCVQILCKFVCFNGKSSDIDKDIDIVSQKNDYFCKTIEEIRLYNYEFPQNKLSHGFLGNYSDKIQILYVASSNISDIDTGTFANGIFQKIYFENLNLKELRKEFFKDISADFQSLSIIQKEEPLEVVNVDFLSYVKYKIKSLTMQVGLSCVKNLTGGEDVLNNLQHVDFSYNNLSRQLTDTSFCRLSMVEHLDLSHSSLEYLPSYIFAEFTGTLEFLDLSHNKLKTITRTIFGWRDIPRELKIYADNNEWHCTCELQQDLKDIFVYQTTKLVCSEPDQYKNWSAFDDGICEGKLGFEPQSTRQSTKSTPGIIVDDEDDPAKHKPPHSNTEPPRLEYSTESMFSTSSDEFEAPDSSAKEDLYILECLVGPGRNDLIKHSMKLPLLEFDVQPVENLRAKIVIASTSNLNDSFGLIWFSKVTKEYYKMEINYNEYGLGCYNVISYVTVVEDLIPNMSYTFCVILKQQSKTSPFSCKSIYIGSNLKIQYSAWLTRDMRVTGLSLVIFGIVMFSFVGILMIYLLLKHKPILLKGSKRVTTTRGNNDDIVVFPKQRSVKSFKDKEDKLASRSPFSCSTKRRNSTESVASYQSYINTNLYEVIPAYNKTNTSSIDDSSPQLPITNKDTEIADTECCYLTPIHTVSSSADLVKYAEIPYRAKRVSNDPLPEVPTDQAPLSLVITENLNKAEYADVSRIYMLDSQV